MLNIETLPVHVCASAISCFLFEFAPSHILFPVRKCIKQFQENVIFCSIEYLWFSSSYAEARNVHPPHVSVSKETSLILLLRSFSWTARGNSRIWWEMLRSEGTCEVRLQFKSSGDGQIAVDA